MVENDEFKDYVSSVSFRGICVNNKGFIESKHTLTAGDLHKIERDYIRWGFSSGWDAHQAAERVLQFIEDSYMPTNSNTLFVDRYLTVGTLVQLERACGGVLRMIYCGNMQFMVIFDSLPQLMPKDLLTPLQWTISACKTAYFTIKRRGKQYPLSNMILRYDDIKKVRVSDFKSHENVQSDAIENILAALERMKNAKEMIRMIDKLCNEYKINLISVTNIANIALWEKNGRNERTATTDFITFEQQKVSSDEIVAKVREEVQTNVRIRFIQPDASRENEREKELEERVDILIKQKEQLEEEIREINKERMQLKERLRKYEIIGHP